MITSRPIPFILYVAGVCQIVPLLAFVAGRRRTRSAVLLAAGAAISLIANGIGRILAATAGNNQIVNYVSTPITAACFLAACAEWQVSAKERRAIRFAIPAFLVTWTLLVAFVEDVRGFTVFSYPLFSLTMITAGTWTLLRRAQIIEMIPLHRFDWFWGTLGLVILGAGTALTNAIGGILVARQQYDLFDLVWQTRAVMVISAHSLMAWGIYIGPPVSKFSTAP